MSDHEPTGRLDLGIRRDSGVAPRNDYATFAEAFHSVGGLCAPLSPLYTLGHVARPAWPNVLVFAWAEDARAVDLRDATAERTRLAQLAATIATVRTGERPARIRVPVRIRAQRGGIRFIEPPKENP